jgi:hypothetical protein
VLSNEDSRRQEQGKNRYRHGGAVYRPAAEMATAEGASQSLPHLRWSVGGHRCCQRPQGLMKTNVVVVGGRIHFAHL